MQRFALLTAEMSAAEQLSSFYFFPDNDVSRQPGDFLPRPERARGRVRQRHGRHRPDLLPLADPPVHRDGAARRVDRVAAFLHHRVGRLRLRGGHLVDQGVFRARRLQIEPLRLKLIELILK